MCPHGTDILVGEKKISEYEAVKTAVAQFMARINEDEIAGKIIYEKRSEQLLYVTEKEAIQISALSAGYQSLVWIAFDIACRMAILNPFLKETICQTSGIVLIDEIDLHLHPKWQWNVLNALHEVFPNVQFIVTTHLPIIIASTKGSWLLDIENDEVEYEYTHYGLDINDTLKICQDSQSLPSEIQTRIDDFYLWIDEGELDKAKEVLEGLEKEIGTSVPVVVEARVCYDMERMNCE